MAIAIARGEEVKVHGNWLSPYSRRVEMALKLKGIPYEYIEEHLINKSPELLRYNPVHKKVPVLVHNGKPLAESLVIIEYIDETWKANPILPVDPYQRAITRFWTKFIDEKCVGPLWMACWAGGEERDKAEEESHRNLKTLEEQLKDKRFFGGDTIGFVDIAANFIAHWAIIIQEVAGVELITEDKYPTLCKWVIDFKSCHVVKENLPSRDKLFNHFKARVDGLKATQSSKELYH